MNILKADNNIKPYLKYAVNDGEMEIITFNLEPK